MPKKKVVFFEIEEWEKPYLRKLLKGFSCSFTTEKLTEETVSKAKGADIVSVFVYSHITRDVVDALPKLKFVAIRGTGFDHVDVAYCNEKKIRVSNVPTYGENTVAEHTFALLLNLTRKIHKAWDRTRHLDFSNKGLRGHDLLDKTIGIVGTGSIGRHVIRMAKGFEMKVIAFDPFPNKKAARELGFTYVTFDKLLKTSDVISFHVPYLESTHHLLNKKNVSKLKRGVIVLNTARGGIIETEALVRGLQKGIIGAAGLDVLEEECIVMDDTQVMSQHFPDHCDLKTIVQDHILAEHENVIITPHNAFNSIEAIERILDTTVANIKGFSRGRRVNLVG